MDQTVSTIILIIFFTQVSAVVTRQNLIKKEKLQFECSQLMVLDGVYAFKEKFAHIDGIPADIRIHWKTDSVFFTHINSEMSMSLKILRSTGEIETIKVPGLGQSSTVDNLNDIVYLGTDNGVYKYKSDGTVELHAALGEDVMYVAVNSDGSSVYIATWPQNRVYKINNESQSLDRFAPIINGHGLTIDTRNNMYFVDVATETLYLVKNREQVPIKVKGLYDDKMINVFVSRSDTVYAMDDNGNMFQIDPLNGVAKYLRNYNITGVNSFGMDSADNVIIGVKGIIFKFYVYEKNPCNVIAAPHPRFHHTVHENRRKRQKKGTTTTTSTTEYYEDEEEDDEDEEE